MCQGWCSFFNFFLEKKVVFTRYEEFPVHAENVDVQLDGSEDILGL